MSEKLLSLLLLLLFFLSCEGRYTYYDLPEMEGVLYEQLQADPQQRFTTFLKAIDKVPGLQEELSTSGLYTVFAPTNEAFENYFSSNGKYQSLDQIPESELTNLIKYHILKWMLFSYQFANPGVNKDSYETFLYESRSSVFVSDYDPNTKNIKNLYYANKKLQVYTGNFLTFSGISHSDYAEIFGFGSSVSSMFNVMGASVIESDIASGNGVLHIIDKIMEVPNNVAQEMNQNAAMSNFNELFRERYLTYTYDAAGTKLQGNNGDPDHDGVIDSLFRRDNSLVPGLDLEGPSVFTAFVPNNTAFEQYINRIIAEFGRKEVVPYYVWEIFYKTHFCSAMNWPSKVSNPAAGFVNVLGDVMQLSNDKLLSKKIMSNGIIYQIDEPLESNSFLSITGPAILSKDYTMLSYMMILVNLQRSLTNPKDNYIILAPTNQAFNNQDILMVLESPTKPRFEIFDSPGDPSSKKGMSVRDMQNIIGNSIIKLPSAFPDRLEDLADGLYDTYNGSLIKIKDGKVLTYGSQTPLAAESGGERTINGLFCPTNQLLTPPLDYYKYTANIFPQTNHFMLALNMLGRHINKDNRTFSDAGLSFVDVSGNDLYTILYPSNTSFQAQMTTFPRFTATIYNAVFNNGIALPGTFDTKEFWDFLENMVRLHILKGRVASGKLTTNEYDSHLVDQANSFPGKKVYRKVRVVQNADSSLSFTTTASDGSTTSTEFRVTTNFINKQGIIHCVTNCLK